VQAVNRQNVQLFLRDVATPANADLAWRHPGWFFESVGQTILKDAFFYRQAFVGSLAHLSIQLPVWLQQLYLLLLAVIAITENPPAAFRARARWLCLGVLVVTLITLFAFMLTANTPKTEITHWVNISGIQGRYFIPIAPLGLMLLVQPLAGNQVASQPDCDLIRSDSGNRPRVRNRLVPNLRDLLELLGIRRDPLLTMKYRFD
jgi:uncharacterized membrane protein